MKINGISYWVKDGTCEMLNLDDGLKILRSVYIPESVKELSYPFDRCNNLEHVFFGGGREMWKKLIGARETTCYGEKPKVHFRIKQV